MKDTTSSENSPACKYSAAQPMAGTVPVEGAIWQKGTARSPRASVAFSALDAVRSALSLLSGLFRPRRGTGMNSPESHPEKRHDAPSVARPRKLWS